MGRDLLMCDVTCLYVTCKFVCYMNVNVGRYLLICGVTCLYVTCEFIRDVRHGCVMCLIDMSRDWFVYDVIHSCERCFIHVYN